MLKLFCKQKPLLKIYIASFYEDVFFHDWNVSVKEEQEGGERGEEGTPTKNENRVGGIDTNYFFRYFQGG